MNIYDLEKLATPGMWVVWAYLALLLLGSIAGVMIVWTAIQATEKPRGRAWYCTMPYWYTPEACAQWAMGDVCQNTGGQCSYRRRER